MKWAINGIPGGNATVGTISAGGAYTAPKTIPSPNALQITATSLLDTTATSTGTITFINAPPVVAAVLQADIPVGDFTLVVSGPEICERRRGLLRQPHSLPRSLFLPLSWLQPVRRRRQKRERCKSPVINPDPGSATSNEFALRVGTSPGALSATAAARLLEQSTWGVNPLSLSHVQSVGIQAFLNEQFAMAASTYPAPGSDDDMSVVQKRFFSNALTGQDQLRQPSLRSLANHGGFGRQDK